MPWVVMRDVVSGCETAGSEMPEHIFVPTRWAQLCQTPVKASYATNPRPCSKQGKLRIPFQKRRYLLQLALLGCEFEKDIEPIVSSQY